MVNDRTLPEVQLGFLMLAGWRGALGGEALMYLTDYSRHANAASRGRRLMRSRGETPRGDRLWTAEEDHLCRQFGNDYKLLSKKLPDRTFYALKARCRALGLRPKRNLLSAAELSRLRKLWPRASTAELREAFPNRSLIQLRDFGRYHKIRRLRKPFVLTGIVILDTVRTRCFELGYTMADLDDLAGTKRYFQNGSWWHAKSIDHRAVGRAVQALDGELCVRWREE